MQQASVNTDRFRHCPVASVLNRPVTSCFSGADAQFLLEALSNAVDDVNPILPSAGATALSGVLHRHDGVAMLEFELAEDGDHGGWRTDIDHALKRLAFTDDLAHLLASTAKIARELTGYDHVLEGW